MASDYFDNGVNLHQKLRNDEKAIIIYFPQQLRVKNLIRPEREGSASASSPAMGLEKEKKKGSSSSASSTSPCANLRAAYNSCFNRWYSEKFVKGQWEKQDCVTEWKKYRACLSENLDDKHLSRFLEAELSVDSSNQLDDSGGL